MNTSMGMILCIISGLCWSTVYVDSIRTGFKQKTYCMPLFALGLNVAWEGIYAYYEVIGRGNVSLQGIANTVWVLLDVVIVITYFKYCKNDCKTVLEKKAQIPFGVLTFAICITIQVLFVYEFGDTKAEIYSAYLQNIAMSMAYLYMLNRRQSSKGQTKLIAVCKWFGTLAPTLIGIIEHNAFIICTGIICFILDGLYFYFLCYVKKKEYHITEQYR